MAQDFGDDMGNALLNFVTRQMENYLRFGRGRERAFDWWQRIIRKKGTLPSRQKQWLKNNPLVSRWSCPLVLPRKPPTMRRYAARMVPMPPSTRINREMVSLPSQREDAETVAGYAPQFKDVMARLDEQRITDALNHAEPVDKKTMDSLTELTSYPDLPAEDVTVIPSPSVTRMRQKRLTMCSLASRIPKTLISTIRFSSPVTPTKSLPRWLVVRPMRISV